ncbi:cytochrome c oxidase assembly factor 8 [Anticarsia gemmatalis]|uniref:cytochrome c oxidase assembly factor 8 n=1 Tax=Anticarsia gemmatalis TaxID=129554 RepID=UPI003F770AAE
MISNRIYKLNIHRQCYLVTRHTSTTKDTKSIQPPNPKRISSDMVGPPDPVSNLRTVIFKEPPNESQLEKRYRQMRSEVQEWNHKFWAQHNSRFYQEREEYVKTHTPADKQNLSADEMSVFYKAFLDKNWKLHINYNMEWYKKNFALLSLAIRVKVRKLLRLKK